MKHIKPYQIFEASAAAPQALIQEQIDWLDKCSKRKWKINPQTGLVDVEGQFYCHFQGLTDLKGVRFGKVSGDFGCESNQLTSLEGAPHSVGGNFVCYKNRLTSLEGAPQIVGKNFDCNKNQLTTLAGAPHSVGKNFNCRDNQLTTLEGAPHSVGVTFYCDDNQLTTLDGAPKTVGLGFNCNNNQLTSLEGAPQSVGVDFRCRGNQVSEGTLKGIFELMKNGKSYQQAVDEFWPDMTDEDRGLMYKQMSSLSPEDERKYKALATYGNIKNYL